MNRRQRKFAGIARLMGTGARRWFRNIALEPLLLNAALGAGAADPPEPKLGKHTIDGIEIDLGQKITKGIFSEGDVGEKLAATLAAIQQELVLAHKNGWGKEAIEKAQKDVQAAIDGYKETLADYRKRLDAKQPDGPAEGKFDKRAFSSLDLRFDPVAEARLRARSQHEKSSNGYLEKMSLAQFNMTCVPTKLWGIEDEKAIKYGNRFQRLHDVLSMAIQSQFRRDPFFDWKQLPWAAEYQALAFELGQAVRETRLGPAINETNADEGKNWVPGPILSGRLYPMVEEEILLPGAFESIPMAAKTVDSGVLGAHLIAYRLVENILDDGSSSGAKIKASAFVTKKFTLDAELYAAGVVLTPNWLQDNALANADWAMRDLAYAMANGEEQWLINGQATAAIDTVSIASDDIRNNGDGLRYWAKEMKDAGQIVYVDMGAGIVAEDLPRMFGQQKSYGARPRRSVWALNTYALAQLMVLKTSSGRDVVLTFGQAGDRATFRTGVIAQMFDRDIITANNLTQTHDAAGVDDGVSDRGVMLHVFTEAVKFGRRLGVSIEMSSEYRFLEYQEVLRAVARGDWGRVYDPTVHPFISVGVNIPKLA